MRSSIHWGASTNPRWLRTFPPIIVCTFAFIVYWVLIVYAIIIRDCGPGFHGPGFNLLIRNDLSIAAKKSHGIRPIFKRFGGFGRIVFRFFV